MLGGYCAGIAFVALFFEAQQYGECRRCPLRDESDDGFTCAVLEQREPPRECEALEDKIQYEGIKLYGVNRPPDKGRGLKVFRR
jgi:hypothetical protein